MHKEDVDQHEKYKENMNDSVEKTHEQGNE